MFIINLSFFKFVPPFGLGTVSVAEITNRTIMLHRLLLLFWQLFVKPELTVIF